MKVRRKKGFTLIELIVTIVIIVIIAIIAIPNIYHLNGRTKTSVDTANLKTLNNVTGYYAVSEGKDLSTIFENVLTDEERMEELVAHGYLDSILTPTQEDGIFTWDNSANKWEIVFGDPVVIKFVNSIKTSSITYTDFLTKRKNFNVGSDTKYNPNSWNGYLEKILESGNVASNNRIAENEGKNTIGYENPYSGKGSVVNFNNWETIKRNYPSYLPPAIFITNINSFDYNASNHTYIQDNISNLKGTMVFYKSNTKPNSKTQVYYIKQDGTLSDLMTVQEVLK